MPTPLQILLDPVSLTVLGLYGALILLEALFPARTLPQVKGWKTRALVVFVFYFYLSSYLPCSGATRWPATSSSIWNRSTPSSGPASAC